MNNNEIISELEKMYAKYLEMGNLDKANEVLNSIIKMKEVPESAKEPSKNILLG